MDPISRGRSRNVAESAIARRAATTTPSPISVPVPLKPSPVSPLLLRSSSTSSFPPSTAGSISPNSSSSSSPDYYGSPPSPPLTLEDQVHVAYAHDDIHTAKILLLRLKGIEVTDNDDPRIAEVQDEDFDFCFAPNGGLVIDIQDEKAMQERQQRELERMEERRRQERLRMCEIKWEQEKRRMQEEQMAMRRYKEQKRQEEDQRRWRLEEDQVRQQQASQDHHQRRTRSRSDRKVVSYSALWSLPSSPSSSDDDQYASSAFVYDFMPTPTSKYSRRSNDDATRPSRSYNDVSVTTRTSHHHRQLTPPIDDAHSVPFADVLKCMQGSLFPVTNEERRMRARRRESLSPSASHPRSHSQAQRIREDKLMEILLDDTAEEPRTTAKGKAKAIPRRRRSSAEMCVTCRSLSIDRLPSTTSSSASSSGSRLSWLWFQSSHSHASSTSSLATTPSSASSSPRSTWLKLADAPQSRRFSSISTTSVASSLPSSPSASLAGGDQSCRCWRKNLTPVDIAYCPLTLPLTACGSPTYAAYTSPLNYHCRTTSVPVATTSKGLVQTVSSTVSHGVGQLVELVHGFQQAYVAAAMFSVALSVDGDRWEERKIVYEEKENGVRIVGAHSRGRHAARTRNAFNGLKPRGCRVSAKDVAAFLSVKVDGEEENASKNVEAPVVVRKTPSPFTNIALSAPYGAAQVAPQPPRGTVLPSPLPYKLFFKPVPPSTRSPFRFNAFSHLHTTYPDGQCGEETKGAGRYLSNPDGDVQLPAWRIRSVGNPAYLRLKALENAVWQKGMVWEGRGREMSLGGGRDRVVGVAFEGIGCSRLARSAV